MQEFPLRARTEVRRHHAVPVNDFAQIIFRTSDSRDARGRAQSAAALHTTLGPRHGPGPCLIILLRQEASFGPTIMGRFSTFTECSETVLWRPLTVPRFPRCRGSRRIGRRIEATMFE